MICKCNIIDISGKHIIENLGKGWNFGPVVIQQDPGSSNLSIIANKEVFDTTFVTLMEFKSIVLSSIETPLIVKFSITGDRGEYGFNPIQYDDTVACTYNNTVYAIDKIILSLNILAKGKELAIFNGNSNNEKQSGGTELLYWASILKKYIH